MRLSLLFFLILIASFNAFAFPEMIRHGYINCTACHVSPAGGGLMTTYGRSISKEVLSRWGAEGEENVLHGAIQDESVINWINGSQDVGFNIGGDVRYIQQYTNSDVMERGRFFAMQRDLELAFKWNQWIIASTFGYRYFPNEADKFETRRYYLMYQPHESVSIRVGRFLPIYGLMIADHYTDIKRGLRFDQGQERDNFEINFIKDNWSATLTYSQTPQLAGRPLDKALAAQLNYAFTDTNRVGFNYWKSESDLNERAILGLTGLFGFTPEFYALSEFDMQTTEVPGAANATKGLFYFQKLGYEFSRGLHAILQVNGSQSDLDLSSTKSVGYGAGLNFYPRPHFEIQALWSRFDATMDIDMGYVIMHYYF